ncbi:site-specific integrase [Micromonospora sp. WMMD812]|uniref:tyrosine-type recombinase/integrase n=1 Tax=Micromonospora sp. WMMD812 TaxID=3015152 RepID=UPI00248C1EDB|nr:site-specific integrase [Micromonospora sp. WMMD812]WBB65380.1 site-specific integrase [Micromonospora sp. WMMD812]
MKEPQEIFHPPILARRHAAYSLPSRLPPTHTPWSGPGPGRQGGAPYRTNDLVALALVCSALPGSEGVRLPRVVREEPVFLDHDQVARLAEACGRYRLLVRALAYTGLRWGEASALRVSRLDLLRRRVTVAVAFAEVGGELVEGTPKNHQRRSVPIPRFLVDELAAHVAGKRRDELVFTAPAGGPLRNTNFRSRVFAPAAASVGLAGLTPHDLRHTAASLAVAAGANVKAVQRMLGHASASMTLDVYAGLFGDDLDAVANRLDEAVAARDADYLRTGTVGGEVVDLGKRRSPGR